MKLSRIKNSASLVILLVSVLFSSNLSAQSLAYKALLSTLYDSKFPVLKPAQLSDLSNYQVLDTREKEEFDVSHIKDAEWVGYDTFTLMNVASLDKNKPVLVYCTVGARSQNIGKKLKDAGFTQVYNLYGGLIEWVNEEKPIFQGNTQTNKVHTYSKSWGIWLTKGEKVY